MFDAGGTIGPKPVARSGVWRLWSLPPPVVVPVVINRQFMATSANPHVKFDFLKISSGVLS